MLNQTHFICPICRLPLENDEKLFFCPNNHCFDKAKQGYVNLLISNKQGVHGDDKLMVKARQTFLEKGYYGRMRDSVSDIIGKGYTVLDAGCGEGYYTSVFSEGNTVFGIDISKEALKVASRKCKDAYFAVASIYDIPMGDNSVDVIVNIFAPDSPSEYLRLIKPNGRLVMVTPMENHLMELKKAVYDNPYVNAYVEPSREGFSIISQKEIKYEIDLECNEDIILLFKMTPYYYNTSPKDVQKLDEYDRLTTRVEFLITEYEKI